MSEVEKCPECGSANVLHDLDNGEVVCRRCGFVLGEAEFAPPPERVPKIVPDSPLVYTSFAVGTEVTSRQRAELNAAQDVDRVMQKLGLPRTLRGMVMRYLRRLWRGMRERNLKVRLNRAEQAVVSVWFAVKATDYPLTANEYISKLQGVFNITFENLLKLEKRAGVYTKTEARAPNLLLVTNHVNRIAAKLEGAVGDCAYLSRVCSYALQIVHESPWVMARHKPALVAAAALLAADELFGRRLHVKAVADAAVAGAAGVTGLAKTLKKNAPSLPMDSAGFMFQSLLENMLGAGVKTC